MGMDTVNLSILDPPLYIHTCNIHTYVHLHTHTYVHIPYFRIRQERSFLEVLVDRVQSGGVEVMFLRTFRTDASGLSGWF